MSFNVGDTVSPIVNLTFSGVELATAGVSGTVLQRSIAGVDLDSETYYSYQVNLSETFTLGSGSNLQSSSIFWFSELDLGGTLNLPDFSPDVASISQTVSTNKSQISAQANDVINTKNNVNIITPYFDAINSLAEVAASHDLIAQGTNIETGNESVTSRPTQSLTDKFSFDTLILKELTDNLLAYNDVITSIKTENEALLALEKEQALLAAKDDAENEELYLDTFVYNNENVFSPDESSTQTTTTDNVPITPETSITDNLPDDVVSPDLLNRLKLEIDS